MVQKLSVRREICVLVLKLLSNCGRRGSIHEELNLPDGQVGNDVEAPSSVAAARKALIVRRSERTRHAGGG